MIGTTAFAVTPRSTILKILAVRCLDYSGNSLFPHYELFRLFARHGIRNVRSTVQREMNLGHIIPILLRLNSMKGQTAGQLDLGPCWVTTVSIQSKIIFVCFCLHLTVRSPFNFHFIILKTNIIQTNE